MAGGYGTRLYPVTKDIPKALVKIRDKPIIEIILDQLKTHNIKDIILCLNHKSEDVISFIKNSELNIDYSIEDIPLGSVGPLSLIKDKLDNPFLLMYCDSLTKLNFSDLLEYHTRCDSDITMAVHVRHIKLEYGICDLSSEKTLLSMFEKPTLDFFVNTGIWIVNPKLLKLLEHNKYMDDYEFIKTLMRNNIAVNCYVFSDYWVDIGTLKEYKRACDTWSDEDAI